MTALNSIANSTSGRHGGVAELKIYARSVITEVFNHHVHSLIGEWQLVCRSKV
ncbi:hypothetical protein [Methyloprofundus sedimenti]|uniref:hypothetical protein n=1 Tax=Methyloprofundus sedimenti TaxID=1420851 RepID=UPI001301AF7A|nr:hypothetical protein [Methyloprofundus sedimenti]